MGGPGSGDWTRWNKRVTTDDFRQLDIRYLRKQGLLTPGYRGNLSWKRGSELTGYLEFRVEEDQLILSRRVRVGDSTWQQVDETVLFDRTPCNYGGIRQWFLCPKCGKRIAVLYGAGTRYLCRHCNDIPYASQNETYEDRMRRKARKIRVKLEASENLFEPVWFKPKGMHQRTFDRLRKAEREANQAALESMDR